MADISFKNISKEYPSGLVSVSDFNLEAEDGEIVVLVGPSGCGKTTTLRMVAGLEEITGGELRIGGRVVNNVEPKDRNIGMIFQNYILFPHMTVSENIALGLKPLKIDADEVNARVDAVSQILDLKHLLGRKPQMLSGGQRLRVALACAFVRERDVILLDEPLSNLDMKLRACMTTELKKLNRHFKTTFIYVTHDQGEAMAIADRIVIMDKGVIKQTGAPEYVYTHPANIFSAGFLGCPEMNIHNVTVTEKGGKILINLGGAEIRLPEERAVKAGEYVGKEVFAGIRPGDYLVDDSADPSIKTTVEVREFYGDKIRLHCKDESGEFTVFALPDCAAKEGDGIGLSVNPHKIHLFDKDTGNAIA